MAFFAVAIVILLDQISKAGLATSCNKGIAFGLWQNAGSLNIIFPVFIIAICLYFLVTQKKKILSFSLALIVGGGISNLIDRLTVGCVGDFIDLGVWPSFNLADSAVTIGVLILILAILTKPEAKNSNDSNH